ncbi:uncharacterized protein EV420DRAFT_644298 [Desarmillaria tabescens]|uniref:Uncharacterized protein n=1 Tax=Armillaria tabescens TaxID=1929756 RepID=A0AA39NJH1_ARMTA|nr:uncharacterized protein EV420DRAFT_644298 [Desarmillaria tabescens]KAK0466727.1 hypothetical protein EV420DRAFT_644298 [Desarmillaria tabescens]
MNFLWALIAALSVYYVFLSLERALRRRLSSDPDVRLGCRQLGSPSSSPENQGHRCHLWGKVNTYPQLREALVLVLIRIFSIAGLTAARVCHDHFEDVVIIEPEAWLNFCGCKTSPFVESAEQALPNNAI